MIRAKVRQIACACVSAVLLTGCAVDPDYTSDKIKNLNPEMTLFQNGISFPMIKNTAELRADSLLKTIEDPEVRKLFNDKDGKYELKFTGHENLDSFIKDLKLADALKINPVEENVAFSFEYGDLDPEKFKSEASHFGEEATMPDLSGVSDIKIDPVDQTVSADTGLKGKDFDIKVNVDPFNRTQTIFSKTVITGAGEASPAETVSLPNSTIDVSAQPESISAFSIPSSIKKVNSVTLKDNAAVVINLSLANNVFTNGTITPDVDLDFSDLFTFTGGAGTIDLSSMVLDQANGFNSSKSFPISGVNVAKLSQTKSISISGTVSVTDAKSTKSKCAAAVGDLGINISISFQNFEIQSVGCDLDDINASVDEKVVVKMDDIELPKEVESVKDVTFTEESNFTLKLFATNLDKISGAALKAKTLTVTFPEGLEVSGDNVSDNVLTLSNVDLGAGTTEAKIKVTKLTLPAPVGGKISYSPEIKVAASCTANGTINTADIKKLGGGDVSVSAKITGTLKVADFQVTVNEYKATIPTTQGKISFDVPEKAASYGQFTIIPAGSPKISVKMTIPDLGGLSVSAGEGITIKLPSFLVLGNFSYPELSYDKTTNTITVSQVKNKTLDLPVEKMVATAVKTATGYQVTGDYEVKGTVSVAKGTIGKNDISKISGAKLGFTADVPSMKASSISVESLSFDVNESCDFEILKSADIPGELVSIGDVALKDVTAKLGLEVQGMPSIGSSSKFIVDLTAELPSFVKPSTLYIKGEIKDGKFTNPPIPVEGFDMSGFDFPKMKAEGTGLKGTVKISGRIYAENPEVELSSLSGKVNGTFKASISGSDNKIKMESLQAKLDYHVDTAFFYNLTELNKSMKNIVFDLPDISAVVGLRSNLAISANAIAKVVPVKGVTEDETKAVSKNLVFPYCQDPAKSDTVTNTLSLNLNEILNSKPDSLKISVNISTDKARDCYIVPDAEYALGLGYDVSIPLKLGSGTKLEIVDTLDLDGSLSGLEKILSKSSFGVTGDIESTFPVGVKLKLEFLSYDKTGGVYRSVPLKSVETNLLEPNSTSSFQIATGPEKSGTTIPEITHLRLSCQLTSDGKDIGPKNYIKIMNLIIVLPEGITFSPENI